MNAIRIIRPYKWQGTWVFDDAQAGLVREPFVAGADVILDRMVEGIPHAHEGVGLLFSAQPFPGYQFELRWKREEFGGNWYYSVSHGLEGWLCPAMFAYFDQAPERIFVQVKPLGR
jgi:hypothetical protein